MNHFILIVIIIILLCLEFCCFSNKENKEVSNDSSSEKNKEVQKKIMFSAEKRGQRLFLYFIYLFPLIISACSPVKDNFNIFHSIKEYMSFYATALTITFAVYSFLETQEATKKERNEREDKENNERKKREDKDFELREKELEAQKDYYRPIFVVTNNPDKSKNIILLMKNDNLYLENIIIHSGSSKLHGTVKQCKSGEVVESNLKSLSFYITAQTLVGETILFGYLIGGVKIYKYLNHNKNPKNPEKGTLINESAQKEINDTWGSYNKTSDKYDIVLEQIFFDSTLDIRNEYVLNYMNAEFKKVLYAETYKDLFKSVFWVFDDFLTHYNPDKSMVSRKIFSLIEILIKKEPDLNLVVSNDTFKKIESFASNFKNSVRLTNKITEYKQNKNFEISNFLEFLYNWCLDIIHNKGAEASENYIITLVKLLAITFCYVDVTSKNNEKLFEVKKIILTL